MPLTLRLDDGFVDVADVDDATHALLFIEPGLSAYKFSMRFSNVRSENVFCLVYAERGFLYYYADIRRCTEAGRSSSLVSATSLLADRPLVAYGSHKRELTLEPAFGCITGRIGPSLDVQRRGIKARQGDRSAIEAIDTHWEKSKLTGAHHTLIRPSEVLQCCTLDRLHLVLEALELLWSFVETEAFAAGVLLWAASCDTRLVSFMLRSTALWSGDKSVSAWAERAKRLTSGLKMHQHYTDLPLEQMFELNVLVNRGVGDIDWNDEKKNRTVPDLVSLPDNFVRDEAKKVFLNAARQGYFFSKSSWREFWDRRWASTPGGSIHSQYQADIEYVAREHELRNKFFTVVKMPQVGLQHFLSRPPEIVAWASEKYEWGKKRAIYGTDLTSYLLTDFALPAAEEALSHVFPVGRKADESFVRERVALAGSYGVSLCYDYADFNSQHSLKSQYEVIMAYADVFSASMDDDQRAAIQWVARSVLKQHVKDPNGEYDTRGTLLSGCRLTTFINTLLNRIYLQYCGAMDHVIDSVHNGDDVLAYCPTVYDAVMVMRKAKAVGIRAQPAKCAIAGIEEFLRVDRAAVRQTGSQYLTRAIATAVHARAESAEPLSVYGAYTSQLSRLEELQARGAPVELCSKLREIAATVIGGAFNTDPCVLKLMSEVHVVHGGISYDRDIDPKVALREEETSRVYRTIDYERLPGVRAYAQSLCETYEIPFEQAPGIARRLGNATCKAVELVRRRLLVEPIRDRATAWVEQQLKGVCKDNVSAAGHIGRARLAGLPIYKIKPGKIAEIIKTRLACSDNPMRMLQIMF